MIPHSEIQVGDWILVDINGEKQARKVEQTSVERIGTRDGEKSGWFFPEEVYPIKLTEKWLKYFGFNEEESQDGELKYRLGDSTFTLTYPDKNNKNQIILDCHGSHLREFEDGLTV